MRRPSPALARILKARKAPKPKILSYSETGKPGRERVDLTPGITTPMEAYTKKRRAGDFSHTKLSSFMTAAFYDELEKIAGLPRAVRDGGGGVIGSFMRSKNRTGKAVARAQPALNAAMQRVSRHGVSHAEVAAGHAAKTKALSVGAGQKRILNRLAGSKVDQNAAQTVRGNRRLRSLAGRKSTTTPRGPLGSW
jgi:hypothetical protein